MSKSRTWILSIAAALGLTSLAQAQPRTIAYVPATYDYGTVHHGPAHNGSVNGPAHPGNGACANGAGASHGFPSNAICPKRHCPPPHQHCMEGPPRLRFKRGCPAPVCPPCDAPNWGYFQPCWNPWPWPPDWSHCPVIPPAATVAPGPLAGVDIVPHSMVPPVPPRKVPGL